MIVKTKYRDVPWEEIEPCCQANGSGPLGNIPAHRAAWAKKRGTAVQIYALPMEGIPQHEIGCGGPFYPVVGGMSRFVGSIPGGEEGFAYTQRETVCPHLVEIGD